MQDELISEKVYSAGRVVVDKSFHTQSGDEAFFGFFGNDVVYSIRFVAFAGRFVKMISRAYKSAWKKLL